jgi:hypothetical protein
MTEEKKPEAPQNVHLPALPLPNTVDESIAAGLELRRSVEQMVSDQRKHAKKVSRNIVELAASLVPLLLRFRGLVAGGWEKDVNVYLSLVGCPDGERRPHPTAAARDPLAFMLARWRTHPTACGELSKKMNWAVSKAAAIAAHLANQDVSTVEEAKHYSVTL